MHGRITAVIAVLLLAAVAFGGRLDRPAPAADRLPPANTSPLSAGELANAAATIDRLVLADLAKADQQPNAPASDWQFLRRVYLLTIGRIPTADETMAFLASTASTKREQVIDRLMASEGRVLHEFTFWADLLRVSERLNDKYPGQPWIDWIKQALRSNLPYDRFVRDMLIAEGPALASGNGATGFWLRDGGMPFDRVANLTQVFLGTQVGCAQCHNHPFDDWSRRQFFEFSAFTANSDARRSPVGTKADMKMLREEEKKLNPEERQALRRITDLIGVQVNETVKSTIPLPEDYQYDDAKPKAEVQSRTLFGHEVAVAKDKDPRLAFADWLTSPENPRFTLVIANRIWKRAFGYGLVEPVDNFLPGTEASNPELMLHLTRLMASLKYDVRAFEAILLKTQAWQRQASQVDLKPGETYHFPGPMVRRLSAEQVWDSLLTLAVPNLDNLKGKDASNLVAYYEDHKDLSAGQTLQMAKDMALAREHAKEIQERLKTIRTTMSTAKGDQARDLRNEQRELNQRREAMAQKFEVERYKAGGKGERNNSPFLRAAELQQPAPAGHFLNVFGQSDREVIDNGTASPAVTQALHLMNGKISEELAKPGSVLSKTLATSTDDASRIRALYVAILSRQPNADELALGVAYLARYPAEGVQDVAWALINANEFLFVQ